EKLYNIVLKSQRAGIKKVKIGAYGDEVDFAVRHILNAAGIGKYFTHSTGHGVSRKIHDSPTLSIRNGDIIKNGDVITVEPGIYFKGKFGIRIEDMVLVSDKPKVLSKIPTDFKSMTIK